MMKIRNTANGHKVVQVLGGRSNVFLVTGEAINILVDTGPAFMWKALERQLKRLNITKIDYLILTHAHFDHAANAKKLKKMYGAAVMLHRSEAVNLNRGINPEIEGTNPLSRAICRLQNAISWFLNYEPCDHDCLVDSRFDLVQPGFNAYILHTPGHTFGSLSLIVDNEIALVGDCMFGVFRNSIFPPFALDTREMIRSWDKLLATGCEVFIPSHGSASSRILVEKECRKYST